MFREVVFHLPWSLTFGEQILKRLPNCFVGVANVGRRTVERGDLAFDRGDQFFVGRPNETVSMVVVINNAIDTGLADAETKDIHIRVNAPEGIGKGARFDDNSAAQQ